MPDAWEQNYTSCGLDPLVDDALVDSDGDGLENIHEYYNNWDDNISNPCNPTLPKIGRPGIGFFGDSDGTLDVSSGDMETIVAALCGNNPNYYRIYPEIYLVQDLDGTGDPSSGDYDLIVSMLSGNVRTPLGWPTELAQELPAGVPEVEVGHTVAIRVKLTKPVSLARPGFGVEFKVVTGSATLFGGEGAGAEPGSRYDLTNSAGEAQMVHQVSGTGTILVHVELPATDPVLNLMTGDTVTLLPDVEITGI